jgi:aconitate hydratase
MDFRFGIDVMTTETACLSSIWRSDDRAVSDYYADHGRKEAYKPLVPGESAEYDAMIKIDMAKAEPMISAPFHPSRAFTIKEMNANAADILTEIGREANAQFNGKTNLFLADKLENGRVRIDQGIIAGCAGGMYDNICEAADILDKSPLGDGFFALSVYPSSMAVNLRLIEDGIQNRIIKSGALIKPCFCGPCFGAGDVPANNGFSVRHTTRNFINREGSKPADGQLAAVALMDARSIAATAGNGGLLTSAAEIDYEVKKPAGGTGAKRYDGVIYKKRVYNGFGKPNPEVSLKYGPNIAEWPKIEPPGEHILLCLASVIHDPVTTTDELIPSGETSSLRSNPVKLSMYALSRRDPQYVGRALAVREHEEARKRGEIPEGPFDAMKSLTAYLYGGADGDKALALLNSAQIASAIFARKPGDGSAREQAASCQRVLGGGANICYEYATKRYRSNLINWGLLPFAVDAEPEFDARPDDYIYVPDVLKRLCMLDKPEGVTLFDAFLIKRAENGAGYTTEKILLRIDGLTGGEREIILSGCLMNYYKKINTDKSED